MLGLLVVLLVVREAQAAGQVEAVGRVPRAAQERAVRVRNLLRESVVEPEQPGVAVAVGLIGKCARSAAVEGQARAARFLVEIVDPPDEIDRPAEQLRVELQLLVEDLGLDVRRTVLRSEQLVVDRSLVIELGVAADRGELERVAELVRHPEVGLPIAVVIELLAGGVEVGIEVVEQADARRRVVIDHDARIVVGRERSLARALEGIVQPVAEVALQHTLDPGPHVELGENQRRAGRLGIAVEESGGRLEARRRLETQVGPADVVRRAAQLLRAALDESPFVEPRPLHAERQRGGNGHVQRPHHVEAAEVAGGDLGVAVEIVELGLARENSDRAAGRIAAEQRALGAAQHLDAVDVEHAQHRAAGARNVDAVDIQPDAALAGRPAAAGNAADREARDRAAVAARGGDVEVRGERTEVREVLDSLRGDDFLGHRDDRDRGVLEVRLAALGRHDDGLPEGVGSAAILFRSFLGRGGRRQRAGNHAGKQIRAAGLSEIHPHSVSPQIARYLCWRLGGGLIGPGEPYV